MDNTENATSVLREEHQLIEQAILALAWMLRELQTGAVLDHRRVFEMAKLFKNYLERCHHVKEDFLLSMLRACEGLFARYPVQSFYDEHHRTEPLLTGLVKVAQEHSRSNGANTEALVHSLRDIVDFYPGHIWKADNLLFPLADELLRQADQNVLIQQFKWIEYTVGGDATQEFSAMVSEFCLQPDSERVSREHSSQSESG